MNLLHEMLSQLQNTCNRVKTTPSFAKEANEGVVGILLSDVEYVLVKAVVAVGVILKTSVFFDDFLQ